MTATTNFSAGTTISSTWLNAIDEDIFDDRINVKLYGAVGDGSTDDTTAFQSALTAAAGKELYVPAGNYLITSGLSVSNRTRVRGTGPTNSYITYRTSSTSTNQLFNFDNVDNIHIEDIGLNNSNSSGGKASSAIVCNGTGGTVSEIKLRRVYIDGFMAYGVKLALSTLYIILDECRIMNCSNAVSAGGTGIGNAVAIYLGTTVNVCHIHKSRISANDTAILSDTNAKYSVSIENSIFEVNGETGTPTDTINLYNCRGVVFKGNYCEANKTGTSTADSFLRLQSCMAVSIVGNFINGSSSGVGKSKNLIGLSDTCIGVVVESNFLEDPITKIVYVADGTSLTSLRRNKYTYATAALTTYADIMARMSSSLVELDVAYQAAVTTGVTASGGNYQGNFTVDGVDVTKNAAIIATPLNGGSDFIWSCAAISADTVRVMAYNVKGSNNSFTGTVAIRVLKDG